MMNNRWLIASFALAALPLTGCFDTRQVERDIERNRSASHARLTRTEPAVNDAGAGQPDESLPVLSGELTLQECVAVALVHNKEVQIARSRLVESDGQMTEAIATALPKASLQGEQMWKDQEIEFSFNKLFAGDGDGGGDDEGGFDIPPTTYSQEARQIQLLVRQPLYLGGVIGAALDAAKVYTYQAQQQLRLSVQSVQFQARQAWLEALLARELAAVARQTRDNAVQLLEDTRRKFEAGAAARYDVLRAEVRLQMLEAEAIRRDNEQETAVMRLYNTLGVSQASQSVLTGELSYRPIVPDDAALLHQGLLRRPELLIGESMVRLMDDNVRAEQAGNRPSVYLQGSYARTYPGSGEQFGGRDWDMYASGGLVVEWPFFDGFRTRGRVVQARAKLQQQRLDLQRLEQKTQLEITQALKEVQNAEKYLLAQAGNVQNAEEALRLTRVGFAEGAATSLDVINDEVALAQVRSDYVAAIHACERAALALELAAGILGEEPAVAQGEAPAGIPGEESAAVTTDP